MVSRCKLSSSMGAAWVYVHTLSVFALPPIVQLHNALLLSILYNTTRPSLPPTALRHAGWHKRKRDKDGLKFEDRDPKRRRVKATVMAIGKRERAELKMLGLGSKKEAEREKEKAREKDEARQRSLGASLDSRGTHVGKDGLPLALADAKQPPASTFLDGEGAEDDC